ncbi:MAG: hypothetical protein QM759_02930 [Terricaulis sp.]
MAMILTVTVAMMATVGFWFLLAVGLEFASVYAEQAGAVHKPEGEAAKREGFGGFALALTTTLTPAFLFLHGFFLTAASALPVRIAALGAVVAAVLLGAIIGRLVGMGWKSGAGVMRALALPLGLIAFVIAIYACRPSLEALIDLFQGRAILLPVLPV